MFSLEIISLLTSKVAQLVGQGQQYLVLIVYGLGEEGNQLGPCALLAQSECNGGQFLDGVQPKLFW